jgi:hypothetical protein
VTASAHHSFNAEYDASKPLKLTGAVTRVEWKNPHAYSYIDVTDETGKVTNWALEMGGSSALLRAGWGPNTTKVGDALTVEGSPAKDGQQRREREGGGAAAHGSEIVCRLQSGNDRSGKSALGHVCSYGVVEIQPKTICPVDRVWNSGRIHG